MNAPQAARAVGVASLAVALLAGAVRLEAIRERAYPASTDDEDVVYLRSGTAIRRMAGAYSALAADVYWIRAVQYYGGTKRRLAPNRLVSEPSTPEPAAHGTEYQQLFPLLDITTTLDPLFTVAYRFGAVFLAEAPPGGPGRPDLAVSLLQKGLAAKADKWEYMEDAGFVHYWYRHDYREAAAWFAKAGDVPGAPVWLKALAATTLAQGGDRRSSRLMWEALRQSADLDWLRSNADFRLAQLRALDEIDALQSLVGEFAKSGALIAGWPSLIRAGALRGVPLDPRGTPYELSVDNRVRLSRSSTLWPLPDEPVRAVGAPS